MRRRGFTLIELLLALALSVTLVALIAQAVSMCFEQMESGRVLVERARLVSGLMEIIASDLRSVRAYDPQDTSQATALAETSAAFDVDSLDSLGSGSSGGLAALAGSAGGSGSSSSGASGGGSSGSAGSSGSTTAAETTTTRQALGVWGNLSQLTIDVPAIPPDWQILALTSGEPVDALPPPPASNTMSVAYNLPQVGTTATTTKGLRRLAVDRDVLAHAITAGTASELLQGGTALADEVIATEFRYFDGTQLLEVWDMDERQALPFAIQVTIYLPPVGSDGANVSASQAIPYTMTVPIRGIETQLNDQQQALQDQAAAASGASTSTSGDGSGTGGGTGTGGGQEGN